MKEILLAMLITSVFISGILLDSIAQQEPQQVIEIQPTVTPTPTPDRERIQLMKENERLRQEVKTLQVFKSDFEGLVEAQIRR
jgi:hypothetical protein